MPSLNSRKSRLSNFEALRLLCMLMILNLHSFYGYNSGGGIFQALDFFRETTSICAVDCFVLISGYFGIRWKFRSFFNLVFQIYFYSVGVYLVAVGLGFADWNIKDFAVRFACLYTSSWGFVVSYVMLYFSAPLLNMFAEKSSPRNLLIYIIVMFVAINFVSLPTSSFFTYALVYMIGRYLSKVKINEFDIPAGKLYWITTCAIFIFVYLCLYKVLHISDMQNISKLPIGVLGYSYSSPFVLLQAVFLFCFFAKMKFNSRFINWCATSSFAIFLIHMHPTIKEIGYYSYTRYLYELPVVQHILLLVVLMTSVFFLSIMIDKVRIFLSDISYKVIHYAIGLVPYKYKTIEAYIPMKLISVGSIND